jgi:hypothetical protein
VSITQPIARKTGHPFQSNALQILYFFKAADTASTTLHWALNKWRKAKAFALLLKKLIGFLTELACCGRSISDLLMPLLMTTEA